MNFKQKTNHFITKIEIQALNKFPKACIKSIKQGFSEERREYDHKENNKTVNELINFWEIIKSFVVAECVVLKGEKYAANVGINVNNDFKYICNIKDGVYNKMYCKSHKKVYKLFCIQICNIAEIPSGIRKVITMDLFSHLGTDT